MLQQIYRSGFAYHKANIMLGDICPNDFKQQALWLNKTSPPSSALMQTLDQINQRFGLLMPKVNSFHKLVTIRYH